LRGKACKQILKLPNRITANGTANDTTTANAESVAVGRLSLRSSGPQRFHLSSPRCQDREAPLQRGGHSD